MRNITLTLAGLAALAACATAPAAEPLTGRWGGPHVGLELGTGGGTISYDCGAGTIAEPVVQGRDGRFAAAGSHTPGQGGPDRIDYMPPSYPARYSGVVDGQEMVLRVDVPAQGLRLGPFRLQRGAEPMLVRCL